MLQPVPVSLRLPDPLALIDATLTFTVQVLIAQHPELLLPPEVPLLRPPAGLRAARHVLAAIKELHDVLETYQVLAVDNGARPTSIGPAGADDFPF